VSVRATSDSAPISTQCSGSAYRQFDFWLGAWKVTKPDGGLAGRSRITRILDGCVLHEQWVSARPPYTGQSFNTYRAETGTWHQTWVDNSGGSLLLDGKFANGAMVLEGISLDSTGARVRNRITWSRPDSAGHEVRQLWETSSDGRIWATGFDGLYRRDTLAVP
jgi:hypothetical protein